MSRIARQYNYASFFHVIVQGIGKEEIFKEKRYINEYLNLIKRFKEGLNLEIIAYCIMPNHAHLLIKVDKIENLSKFMHKVNSIYARYYNFMRNGRVGYVFRDRFVSEPIDSKSYLVNCIRYIHMNPVKANMVKKCNEYEFSSFNQYMEKLKTKEKRDNYILEEEDYINICTNTIVRQHFLDVNKEDISEKFYIGLDRYIKKEQIRLWQILSNRENLLNLIKYLKNIEKIRYVHIKNVLMIPKGTFESILRDIRSKKN